MSRDPIDLSNDGVDNILAVLAAAGLRVHEHETDGDTFIDIWLTDPHGDDPATILSWRDTSGWQMKQWVDNDVSEDAEAYWFFPATDPAKIAEVVAEELAQGGEPR